MQYLSVRGSSVWSRWRLCRRVAEFFAETGLGRVFSFYKSLPSNVRTVPQGAVWLKVVVRNRNRAPRRRGRPMSSVGDDPIVSAWDGSALRSGVIILLSMRKAGSDELGRYATARLGAWPPLQLGGAERR